MYIIYHSEIVNLGINFDDIKILFFDTKFQNTKILTRLIFFVCWTLVSVVPCNCVAGFYKPTIPQSPPSHLRDYSTCNNSRLEFSTIFVPSFDPNEWCLKNGLHSRGLSPGLLGHESSALTTRPRLLAKNEINLYFAVVLFLEVLFPLGQ
jgi:hypothetical protein